jgi:hypothetical protein
MTSPKLRRLKCANPLLSRGFVFRGFWFWLLQRDGEWLVEQFEDVLLGGGGFGEDRHGVFGSGEPDLVAGQSGEVVQQSPTPEPNTSRRVVRTPSMEGRSARPPTPRHGRLVRLRHGAINPRISHGTTKPQ